MASWIEYRFWSTPIRCSWRIVGSKNELQSFSRARLELGVQETVERTGNCQVIRRLNIADSDSLPPTNSLWPHSCSMNTFKMSVKNVDCWKWSFGELKLSKSVFLEDTNAMSVSNNYAVWFCSKYCSLRVARYPSGWRAVLRLKRARVQIAVATLSGNSLRQTVHTHCASVHQAAKFVAAVLRVAGVTGWK